MTKHTFDELSDLVHSIYTTPLTRSPHRTVLIVAFRGEYGHGAKGNSDARYIEAIIKAAGLGWEHSALIVDYSQMRYEWGDMLPLYLGPETLNPDEAMIIQLFGTAPFLSATVASDLNRENIVSLLQSDDYNRSGENKLRWLFGSLESAILALEDHQHES